MLNDLLLVEKGASKAGIAMSQRHPDLGDTRKMPTLIVQLDEQGYVVTIRPLPSVVTPWTLRDGNHNSFPFVQPKFPLWLPDDNDLWEKVKKAKKDERLDVLLQLAKVAHANTNEWKGWPSEGLLKRLRERRIQFAGLTDDRSKIVPVTIDRFLLACKKENEETPLALLTDITKKLIENVEATANDSWIEVAIALLMGKMTKNVWESTGALLFEASGFPLHIFDEKLQDAISKALNPESIHTSDALCTCALTGMKCSFYSDNIPQPNLPGLGQTYLFSKNKDIPANDRYGRFSADSFPVGQETVMRLDAALRELTAPHRKNKTWRLIPSDISSKSDLLLAFVDGNIDDPSGLEVVAGDEENENTDNTSCEVDSVDEFEKRTERLIELVNAESFSSVETTLVRLAVFRKLDPGNSKIVYSRTTTVANLHDSAVCWAAGERNIPTWFSLYVLKKGESKPRLMHPPHVAPLTVVGMSKKTFIQGGKTQQEIAGLTVADILRIFLDSSQNPNINTKRHAGRLLWLLLTRRSVLVSGLAHALCHGLNTAKEFDRFEVLRTVTLFGVLLHKLGRKDKIYMSETAFKLGQLLAAVDKVHVGYCADVRKGSLPSSLLGNQLLTMAQGSPAKALALLARRWKPYSGWACKAEHDPLRHMDVKTSIAKDKQQSEWDIRSALRHAREIKPLAADLASALEGSQTNDIFRAELLLGYLAGLPKTEFTDNQSIGN